MRANNTNSRQKAQVLNKMRNGVLYLLLLMGFVLLANGKTQAAEAPEEKQKHTPAAIALSSAPLIGVAADIEAATYKPKPTPTQRKPTPTPTPEPLFYNLPPATLTSATGLYASPNRAELVVPVPIPAGETVYVMGRNKTGSHLRVVWNTGVGWVPVSFTDYNGRQDKMKPLPIFTREPPACAVPITTQFGLNSKWTSEEKQRIAVIVDLFRSRYGDFPASYLSLTVNGTEVKESKRQIVEQGQFSLKDVVFTLPADVQPEDTVGYFLDTSSDEPLTFMATIFQVPRNCKWDLD